MMTVLGLMSGTSMDGIDAALLKTDGERIGALGATLFTPYTDEMRAALDAAVSEAAASPGGNAAHAAMDAAAQRVTRAHIAAVEQLLGQAGLKPADIGLIGFHGQTVLHAPEHGVTIQLGDGAALAAATGIDVVNDFRQRDLAAGGEGAPFAPAYHAALARKLERTPAVFVNIGGVGNVTWVGPQSGGDGGVPDMLAFDTGPGNVLLDEWMKSHAGAAYDKDGAASASGTPDEDALAKALAHDYFAKPPPKSLDRDAFSLDAFSGLTLEDGAASLAAFTAETIAAAQAHFPQNPALWVVCGGGRKNAGIMKALAARVSAPVLSAEEAGFDGDFIEAQAFGYLAARSVRGLALSYPGTTGVPEPMTGGVLHHAIA